MATERDALELLADLRAHIGAYPNDSKAVDELRRLVQEMDSDTARRPIDLSTRAASRHPRGPKAPLGSGGSRGDRRTSLATQT